MSAQYITLPDDSGNAGKKVQLVQNTVNAQTVEAQCVALVTSAGTSVDPPSGTGVAVCGNVNSGASDSGSPVKVGGVYNATLPTLTDAQRGDLQLDPSARLLVSQGDKAVVASNLAINTSNSVGLTGLSGVATAVVQVTGTWVDTLTFQGRANGANYFTVLGAVPIAGGAPVTTTSANGQWLVPVAGLADFKVQCTAATSGTAVVSIDCSSGANVVFGIVQGNTGAGGTDSGNGVKVSGVYNTTAPTYTNGQRGDIQLDASGNQKVVGAVAAATLSGTSASGAVLTSGPGEWAVSHAPAVATQATASKTAGGAGVRHVCTSVSGTIGADATGGAAAVITINLRDGATGAGSILMSWTTSTPGTAGTFTPFSFSGFKLVGSANTAMTIETSAATGSHEYASVNASGYDVS